MQMRGVFQASRDMLCICFVYVLAWGTQSGFWVNVGEYGGLAWL
jgi:hypothetical protein